VSSIPLTGVADGLSSNGPTWGDTSSMSGMRCIGPFVRACQCDALEVSGILCLFFVWFRGFSPERNLGGSECRSARPVGASSPGVSGFS